MTRHIGRDVFSANAVCPEPSQCLVTRGYYCAELLSHLIQLNGEYQSYRGESN